MSRTEELRALIEEVGGPDRLSEILIAFYEAMSRDILIGFFFTGRDLARIASMQQQFILKAAGLIPSYDGKTPISAHMELPPILSGHFDRRLRILEDLLASEGLSDQSIEAWIGFENAFRAVIVSDEK